MLSSFFKRVTPWVIRSYNSQHPRAEHQCMWAKPQEQGHGFHLQFQLQHFGRRVDGPGNEIPVEPLGIVQERLASGPRCGSTVPVAAAFTFHLGAVASFCNAAWAGAPSQAGNSGVATVVAAPSCHIGQLHNGSQPKSASRCKCPGIRFLAPGQSWQKPRMWVCCLHIMMRKFRLMGDWAKPKKFRMSA